MEKLTQFGLSGSRFTVFVMIILLALGASSYLELSKREDPSITIRTAVVSAEFPGMAPERVEDLIADPIERRARQISEIKKIKTLISTGRAVIYLDAYDSLPKEDIGKVFQEIRNKMGNMNHELPAGTDGPYVNTDYGDVAIATVAVTGDGYSYAEIRESAKALRRHLETIKGIGKITLFGEQKERVWLEIDSRKLAAVGVQLPQLLNDLQSQNVILPAGDIDADGVTIILEANGDLKNVESIKKVLTKVSGLSTLIKLEDLLNVRRGYEEPRNNPTFFNGDPSIILSVQMADGQDIQVLGPLLKNEVGKFEQTQPIGIAYSFSTYQETKVTEAVNDALSNVGQTAGVVLLVLTIFLGLRPALIVACIVPFSVMFAIIAMKHIGIELQIVSIAAVIISLGLLVDNGLVIVEDIQGRIASGVDPKEAALGASRQFGTPLSVASITTVAAFMPLFILEGAEGEYGFSLGAVVALMLVGSWFTAMYLLPTLCAWFSKKQTSGKPVGENRLTRVYAGVIRKALPLSAFIVAGAYGLIIVSSVMFGNVRNEMFPLSSRNQFLIYMDLPKGSSISETERVALKVEKWLANGTANPEVTDTTIYIGDGGPRFYLSLNPADANPSNAFFLVNTHDFDGAVLAARRAQAHLFENHPEARFKVKRLSLGGAESGIVEVKFAGPDSDELLRLAAELEKGFDSAPGIIQNENDWGNKVLKIVVNISQEKARERGVTSSDISTAMDAFFTGSKVSEFREDAQSIPIVVRAGRTFRDSMSDLENLTIPVNGQLISLDQVATFMPEYELSQLRRENQKRVIKVSAKSSVLSAGELLAHIQPYLNKLDLPDGYTYEIDGEIKASGEVNDKLSAGLLPALVVMLAATVFQFNSARRVMLIFLTIPFVLIGAPLALMATGQPLSFFAILGLISLAGIIINNAIVLIDQIDIERANLGLTDAVVEAARKRVTPITLTTLTTVLGLVPMAVNGGALFEPMAILMIGGLSIASALTLFFVPSAFYLLFGGWRR